MHRALGSAVCRGFVAGWQTGIVHTFLARNGGPQTTEERVL